MTLWRGGCLCGGVRYRGTGALSGIVACHCSQCARTSGALAMMTRCPREALVLEDAATLAWFSSSPGVQRGFCRRCGGNLFWRDEDGPDVYITAGTLDPPTGLRLAEHIFVASKPDFYDIDDSLPRKAEW